MTVVFLALAVLAAAGSGFLLGRLSAPSAPALEGRDSDPLLLAAERMRLTPAERLIDHLREQAWTYRDVDAVFAQVVLDEIRTYEANRRLQDPS